MIGVDRYMSEEWKSGRPRWNGVADLGFPVTNNLRDIAP